MSLYAKFTLFDSNVDVSHPACPSMTAKKPRSPFCEFVTPSTARSRSTITSAFRSSIGSLLARVFVSYLSTMQEPGGLSTLVLFSFARNRALTSSGKSELIILEVTCDRSELLRTGIAKAVRKDELREKELGCWVAVNSETLVEYSFKYQYAPPTAIDPEAPTMNQSLALCFGAVPTGVLLILPLVVLPEPAPVPVEELLLLLLLCGPFVARNRGKGTVWWEWKSPCARLGSLRRIMHRYLSKHSDVCSLQRDARLKRQ